MRRESYWFSLKVRLAPEIIAVVAYTRDSENTTKNNRLTLGMSKLMKMTYLMLKTNDGRQQNDGFFCLRSFVIPTIVSDKRSTKRNEHAGWLVDVTPCLAAYFEVTIMDQDCVSPENTDYDQRRECVAIGLSSESFSLQGKMPG